MTLDIDTKQKEFQDWITNEGFLPLKSALLKTIENSNKVLLNHRPTENPYLDADVRAYHRGLITLGREILKLEERVAKDRA